MALPILTPNGGWAQVNFATDLAFPRNGEKIPFFAQSYLTTKELVYTLTYTPGDQLLVLRDNTGGFIEQFSLLNLITCDLAFDQLNRQVIIWELPGDLIYIHWYDPVFADYTTTQIALGNNPCCCLDDRRDSEVGNSDVFLFYQRGDRIFYRQQRDRFLVEYEINHSLTGIEIETCGMANNYRLTVRFLAENVVLFTIDGTYMKLDNDFIGYTPMVTI